MSTPTVTILAARMSDDGWRFDEVDEAPQTALVAAANYPVEPPSDWFTDPHLDGPTMVTIEPSGRVYGHVCTWDTRHIGLPGHTTPPKSETAYSHFLSGNTLCADGTTVRTGHLTLGTSHAPLEAGAQAASEHYDQTGTCWSDVAAGSDAHGWWVAGALRPDVTPEQVRAARGSSLSGDWRDVRGDGRLEPVAALSVNTPGFGIPQPLARVASGAPTAIVAAGVLDPATIRITLTTPKPEEADMTEQNTPTPDADETAVTAAATASPIAKGEPAPAGGGEGLGPDSIVTVADPPPGVVRSIEGDVAVVEIEVPVGQLEDAGEKARASMVASARDRIRDRERDEMAAEIAKLREALADVPGLVASVQEMKNEKQDAEDDALIASVTTS